MDPEFVKSGCDFITYDREYLPFTLLELLFISDFYVGFNSCAIMEAVYCNLPIISIHVFPVKYQFADYGGNVYKYLEDSFNIQGEWLNYSGVNQVYHWDHGKDDFIKSISNITINSQKQQDYITKFLGFSDGKSSERVLNVLKENYL